MKTTNLFFALLFYVIVSWLSPVDSFTQPTYQWAKNFGGTSTDRGNDITVDANVNTCIIGTFFGTSDFDPGTGTANLTSNAFDIFFAKYDSNGNYLWANKIGGVSNQDRGNSIAVDGSGNIYITGVFGGTADFDPGLGTANLTAVGGSEDVFFAKYDVNGNYLWAKNVGSTTYDYGASITVDAGGSNVYITGYFSGTADFDPGAGTANLPFAGGNSDIFFAKYDFNGNYVWAKSIGGTSADGGNAITVDGSGNVYITGYFYNTADFDPGAGTANLISNGSGDVFFSKYDSNGNYLWSNGIGGNGITVEDMGNDIAVDGSGNIYIIGYFGSTTDFDPGAGTANLFSFGLKDIFFGKYDSNSNYLWAKSIGSTGTDAGTRISVGTNGNVYITGYFSNSADFDPSAGTTNLTSAGLEDIFYSQYTPSGFFICATNIGAVNSDYGNSIALDASGNVYLTGYFQGTADFNPGAGTNNLTSAGGEDVFFLKYTPCVSLIIPNISSQNVLCNGQCTGTATANPSGGTLPYTYSWNNGQTTQAATGLCAVTYTVTVTDAASSVATATILITQPFALTFTTTANPATCGNANGSANASVSGGITPYSFLWSNGQATATATGLAAGTYSITVTDANGCSVASTASVTQSANLTNSLIITPPACGSSNGSVTAFPAGGASPYTYAWNIGNTSATVTGLTGNPTQTLIVTITDVNNCILSDTAIVQCVTGIINADLQDQFIIYPNPTSGKFQVSGFRFQSSDLEVYNVFGKEIYSEEIPNSQFSITINLDLPSGLYFICLKFEKESFTQKLIIQK